MVIGVPAERIQAVSGTPAFRAAPTDPNSLPKESRMDARSAPIAPAAAKELTSTVAETRPFLSNENLAEESKVPAESTVSI